MIVDDGGIFSTAPAARVRKSAVGQTDTLPRQPSAASALGTTQPLAQRKGAATASTVSLAPSVASKVAPSPGVAGPRERSPRSLERPSPTSIWPASEHYLAPSGGAPVPRGHAAASASAASTGFEELSELGDVQALEAELGGPGMSAYAIRTEKRGGVREVKPSARRVMHAAVYEENENGVGAWLKALKAEARALLLQLEHTSFSHAIDELKTANLLRAYEDSDDDADRDDDDDELADVRAVERWLVINGALGSDAAAVARASSADEPTLLLPNQLRPPTREFARAHFDLASRARRTLDALGHELGDVGKQSEFAATLEQMRFNRLLARSQVDEPAAAVRSHRPRDTDGARAARRSAAAEGAEGAPRDDSWAESIRRMSRFVRLRQERSAQQAQPPAAAHGRQPAGLGARERDALRRALSKHRELIRRVFYAYRALDGLQPDLPGGGRLPAELGGPAPAELDGLPPLQPLRSAAESAAHVAADGRRAHRAGEPTDPLSARISLAQLWRLLKDARVLGGELTTAEVDALLAEAGTLDDARASDAPGGGGGGRGARARARDALGDALPAAHHPLASATLIGFAESLVVLAHARYAHSTPSLGRALERLCAEQLEEHSCQGAGCVRGLRAALYASAPVRELFAARAAQLRRIYAYWAAVHFSAHGVARELAARASTAARTIDARAVEPPLAALGASERTANRLARAHAAEPPLASSDASTLRALGAALPAVVERDEREDVGALTWRARRGALTFNHVLVMLAEAQLLVRTRRANEPGVTAAEALRLFEATAAVSGAQPRVCAANLGFELTYGEFLELVARLAAHVGPLGARADAERSPPLEVLIARLLVDSLAPHTDRLLSGAKVAAGAAHVAAKPTAPPSADDTGRGSSYGRRRSSEAGVATHAVAGAASASAPGAATQSSGSAVGSRRPSTKPEPASIGLRERMSSGQ